MYFSVSEISSNVGSDPDKKLVTIGFNPNISTIKSGKIKNNEVNENSNNFLFGHKIL